MELGEVQAIPSNLVEVVVAVVLPPRHLLHFEDATHVHYVVSVALHSETTIVLDVVTHPWAAALLHYPLDQDSGFFRSLLKLVRIGMSMHWRLFGRDLL